MPGMMLTIVFFFTKLTISLDIWMRCKASCFGRTTQCTKPYTVVRTKCDNTAGRQIARLFTKKRATRYCVSPFFGNRHRHILPGRVQPSTFCTAELNFCVRYENRWDLSVIDTGIVEGLWRILRFRTFTTT